MTFIIIIIILFFSYQDFGFCIVRTGVSMIKVKDRTTNPKKREPKPQQEWGRIQTSPAPGLASAGTMGKAVVGFEN